MMIETIRGNACFPSRTCRETDDDGMHMHQQRSRPPPLPTPFFAAASSSHGSGRLNYRTMTTNINITMIIILSVIMGIYTPIAVVGITPKNIQSDIDLQVLAPPPPPPPPSPVRPTLLVDLRDTFLPMTTKIAAQACAGLYNRLENHNNDDKDDHGISVQDDKPDLLPQVYTILEGPIDESWLKELGIKPSDDSGSHHWWDPRKHPKDLPLMTGFDFINQKCLKDFPRWVKYRYYGPARRIVPNVLTVAAVLDAIPLVEDDYAFDVVPYKDVELVFDATTHPSFKGWSAVEATSYVYDTFGNQTWTMAKMNPGYDTTIKPTKENEYEPPLVKDMDIALVDFIFSQKLFCFYLYYGCIKWYYPSYHRDSYELVKRMSSERAQGKWPNPISVYGYDDSWNVMGGDLYEAETMCVVTHNLGQIATESVTNLSFLSRMLPHVKQGDIDIVPNYPDIHWQHSQQPQQQQQQREVLQISHGDFSGRSSNVTSAQGSTSTDFSNISVQARRRRRQRQLVQHYYKDEVAEGSVEREILNTRNTFEGEIGNSHQSFVYDTNKTYVALVVGDGDNVAYIKSSRANWIKARVEHCNNNGPSFKTSLNNQNNNDDTSPCFPLTWTISPHLAKVAPDLLRWYVKQITSNERSSSTSSNDKREATKTTSTSTTMMDTFVLPPSGHLYAYPGMMPDDVQESFVSLTEQDALILNTTGVVDWEWWSFWRTTEKHLYPKYAKGGIIRGIFTVNVPYLLPTGRFLPNEYFKIISSEDNDGGKPVVMFRPREWRGTPIETPSEAIPIGASKDYLYAHDMANEFMSYPKGTVTYLYMTSDGGLNYNDIAHLAGNLTGSHVELVSTEMATALALASHGLSLSSLTQQTKGGTSRDEIISTKMEESKKDTR